MNIDKNYSYIVKTDNFDKIRNNFRDRKIYSINIDHCESEEDFYCEISRSLKFPDYFGRNWDAFNDCIGDLDWLGENQIVIIFKNYNNLCISDIDDRAIALKILLFTVRENNNRLDSKKEFWQPPVIFVLEDKENDHKELDKINKTEKLDSKYIFEV